jgi:hypothetical protein
MAMTFAVFAVYGLFAAARVISRPAVLTWLRRGSRRAATLGAKLALSER